MKVISSTVPFKKLVAIEPEPVKDIEYDFKFLILDVETTGLDPEKDKVIELACGLFGIKGDGIGLIEPIYCDYEDPGIPIPNNITELTGITEDKVVGKKLDESQIARLVYAADFIVAHNAPFDKAFFEARFNNDKLKKRWVCSANQLPWDKVFPSSPRKLEYLAFKCGFTYEAHTAKADIEATALILSYQKNSLEDPMFLQLARVFEEGQHLVSVFDCYDIRDKLKQAGFYWQASNKSWCKQVMSSKAPEVIRWVYSLDPRARTRSTPC